MPRKPDDVPRAAKAAHEPDARAAPAEAPAASSEVPRIDVATLMQGGREAIMVHGAVEYRLRITKAGKLILTK
jgi:hemin uptake protein HemP